MEREEQDRPSWQTGHISPGGQSTPHPQVEHLPKGFKVTSFRISNFRSKTDPKTGKLFVRLPF